MKANLKMKTDQGEGSKWMMASDTVLSFFQILYKKIPDNFYRGLRFIMRRDTNKS